MKHPQEILDKWYKEIGIFEKNISVNPINHAIISAMKEYANQFKLSKNSDHDELEMQCAYEAGERNALSNKDHVDFNEWYIEFKKSLKIK